jgi:hypothetical protein
VDVDAAGRVAVAVVLRADPAALETLDGLGVDPTAELAAVGEVPGWTVTRTTDPDGGLQVRMEHERTDPATATAAMRELRAGLAAGDPALLVDLDLDVDEAGAADLSGRVQLRPAATPGATLDGEPLGPTGEELASLTAQAVEASLQVRFAGRVVDHDADAADGGVLRWTVPVGEDRTVHARAAAPTRWRAWALPATAGVALLLAAALTVGMRRRRS